MILKDCVEKYEREEIIKALKENNWVMARAARMLGTTERIIGYKIKKYGIRRGENSHEKSQGHSVATIAERRLTGIIKFLNSD